MEPMTTQPARAARRSDALSRDRIVEAAIELLDTGGEKALTFRALAARLSTGPGAIYWHVANKDEMLAAATGAVIGGVLDAVQNRDDPRAAVMATALGVFDAIDEHPWIGSQLSQETWRDANTQIFESIGRKLHELGVPDRSQFDAASALTNYISGVAAQNAANARNAPQGMDREEYLAVASRRWAALDPADYPFVHQVLGQLPDHDDRRQFAAGIELILAGIASIRP